MKEIADQLSQPALNTKKAAMKRIIGAMTYGVDVSPLFTEVSFRLFYEFCRLSRIWKPTTWN